jgi:hypothetical protein
MSEQLDALQWRVSALERRIVFLALCCATLTICLLLFATNKGTVKAAAQPEMLTVKRLAVVDEKGTERVVIAAPLPDPVIQGKRGKRDGPASGILIFDPKGNERGGYVTSDTDDLSALISLDSEHGQVFTAYANADSGATVWVANENHDAIAFSTHKQPVLEMIQNKRSYTKLRPPRPICINDSLRERVLCPLKRPHVSADVNGR